MKSKGDKFSIRLNKVVTVYAGEARERKTRPVQYFYMEAKSMACLPDDKMVYGSIKNVKT